MITSEWLEAHSDYPEYVEASEWCDIVFKPVREQAQIADLEAADETDIAEAVETSTGTATVKQVAYLRTLIVERFAGERSREVTTRRIPTTVEGLAGLDRAWASQHITDLTRRY